jgi:DNA-binding transcriptional regulator/RsmH inhibitor MraZ
MAAELLNEYDTTLDSKCRVTVRGQSKKSLYKNYHVKIYKDGHIVLEPRVLVHPDQISKKTLKMMDSAMENYTKGNRSKPIDLDEMRKLADGLSD